MTTILYPTRGGPNSYPNQDKVIELAKTRQAELVFLYVSDVRFLGNLGHTAHAPVIESELDQMGEFLLVMAQERAQKAGWDARTVVRKGDFSEALKAVIQEYRVDTVILGAPGQSKAVTTETMQTDLLLLLIEEFGIEAMVLQDGDFTPLTVSEE